MDIRKKFFIYIFCSMNQNSVPEKTIRPEDLMKEFNIKKDTYYDDVKYLNLEIEKNSENKPYLTFEQAEQIRALRFYVKNTGKREGFSNNSIVKVDDSNLTTSTNNNSEEDIYIEPSEPTAQLDIDRIIRKASELKARELATPDLAIRAIADRMTEDDLPEDLKEKVEAVREAVSPKWTPADLADKILATYRSSRSGN
jgi:hypothetical protein